jgi:DNA (cytosine-5)-methyltransferase 1
MQNKRLKVLNLYAGIGGNRKLWRGVDVTAVELDKATADVYQSFFPDDDVIVSDAHAYLLEHFEDYDFIWSSPPCPSHSRINFSKVRNLEYPDMRLYQEILFLKTWFKGKYCVENVIPYYEPLIPGKVLDKHVFWTNFKLSNFEPTRSRKIRSDQIPELQELTGFDLSDIALKGKRQKLRNCVHPQIGKHILDRVIEIETKTPRQQVGLFA